MSTQTLQRPVSTSCDWRVSAVPELRSILMSDYEHGAAVVFAGARNIPSSEYLNELLSECHEQLRFIRRIGHGEMLWVSADMVQLALDAVEDVPGWVPGADLPARDGFMVLEKSLPPLRSWVASIEGDHVVRNECDLTVEAISWSTIGTTVRIHTHCRVSSMNVLPSQEGSTFETVHNFACDEDRLYNFADERLSDHELRLMSFLAAASILMSSPGVTDKTVMTPKTKAARKAAKKGKPAAVTVVSLHAPAHVETGSTDATGREYTCRWIVRGHWRQQAHGPNRAKRRTTWIPSYVKGPADKPLRETERVWAWRR